jgi:hypothetical protein
MRELASSLPAMAQQDELPSDVHVDDQLSKLLGVASSAASEGCNPSSNESLLWTAAAATATAADIAAARPLETVPGRGLDHASSLCSPLFKTC